VSTRAPAIAAAPGVEIRPRPLAGDVEFPVAGTAVGEGAGLGYVAGAESGRRGRGRKLGGGGGGGCVCAASGSDMIEGRFDGGGWAIDLVQICFRVWVQWIVGCCCSLVRVG